MNTKYPINGRVTTLSDLVHEYATSSTWPQNSNYTYYIEESDVNILQPFLTLVFKDSLDSNNKFIAERPYEIVYFDTVYSSTERDKNGKLMKIIQLADCSVFTNKYPGGISGNDYIKAGDVANPINITTGKYGFKFIVANLNSKGQYYYNYRTSTGEASVMYALRNIISLLKLYKNSNNIANYISAIIVDTSDIIDNNNLKPEAYKYLGDFIWTYRNIKIENYTTSNEKILNIAKKHSYVTEELPEDFTTIDGLFRDNRYWNQIKDVNDNNNDYSYNGTSIYNKLKYYLNIFADSLRFFVSYVTGFRFEKISNKSYLQIEPVLRCDLGVIVLYDYITISSSTHDWHTALPLSAIQEDTRFDVILTYIVKYKNINKVSSPITVTISLTWKDIIVNSEDHGNDSNKIWFCLRTSVCDDPDSDKYKNIVDNSTNFGLYTYGDLDYFFDIKNTSLRTLEWPLCDKLELPDESELSKAKNNPLYTYNKITNYALTSNINTFKDTNDDVSYGIVQNKIKREYAPFGTLRMHNFLDIENTNSGYYCDIDLYRCKNFYINKKGLEVSDININIYYSIPYINILPNTCMSLVSKSFEDVKANDDSPENIISWQDEQLSNNIIYSVPNNTDNEVFITTSSVANEIREYASGETYIIPDTTIDSYSNDLKLKLYWLNGTKWQIASEKTDYIINTYEEKDTLPYYSFQICKSMVNTIFWKFSFNDIKLYTYFRTNKINNLNNDDKVSLSIYTVCVEDITTATIEGKLIENNNSTLSLLYLVYNEINNNSDYIEGKTCLNCFIQSIKESKHILNNNANVYKSNPFYIEPLSFKINDIYLYQSKSIITTSNNDKYYPFNVAYISNINNNKYIYKFIQCNTLFGKEINSRRVKIENMYYNNSNKTDIYLAFEPLYIIEFGSITYSDENNNNNTNCKNIYDDNIKINTIKYKKSAGGDTISIDINDTNTHIFSFYTSDIFLDYNFLNLRSNSIFKDLENISSNYLISYDIEILYYDLDKSQYILDNQNNKITISSGFSQSDINERMKHFVFKPNTQYIVNVNFTYFRQRTGEIACSFSYNYSILNGYITLKIIKLPENYEGSLKENTTYVGNTQPISLPIGCTVKVNNNYIISEEDKNSGNIKWLGWTYTYKNDGKYNLDNPLIMDILETPSNISITSNIFMNQSVNVKVDNNTNQNQSTSDTSSNNP